MVMLKNYFFLALVFSFFLSNIYSQTTTIPDANFEQALIDLSIDTDGTINQSVATADISGVTSLTVANKNILDLTGIEDFLALEELRCQNNNISSLNLFQNTVLTYLNVGYNPITILDVSQNGALTWLGCYSTSLLFLDLSQNTSLAFLQCGLTGLTWLDVSLNTALETLYCTDNQLEYLNVKNGNNSILTAFQSERNPSLNCINVDDETAANDAQVAPYNLWVKDAWVTYSENCAALSLDDKLLAKSIALYPNPVSDILIIDSKIPLTKVEIYSILGQKVKEVNSGFNSIHLDNLSKGIYIVRLQSENVFATKKLIKN
jgi:type IX secretion system substrate protein